MQHADRTIYLDISDLLANAKFQSRVAGIQRVTLRLIAQLLTRRPEARISLIGFHPELKQLVEVDSGWCNEHLDHDHLQFIRVFDLELQTPLQYLRRYRSDPARLLVHALTMLTYTVLPNDGYFEKHHMRRPFSKKSSYGALLRPVQLKAGDKIVILGATWGMPALAQILQQSSSEGVSIVPFVHDLIPMVLPQHVTDATRIAYRQWIRRMADLTHTFLANSKSTAADLKSHLAAIAPDRRYDIALVPLAHEFVERPFASPASWMAYYYPIVAAYPAKLFCAVQDLLPNSYVGLYLLILAGSCAALAWSLRLGNLEVAIVALVSISAFSAYRWLALTGNIAVLEVPLAALSIAALYHRRYEISGAALGLMSTLKVLPLVGVLAFLVLPIGWLQKVRAIVATVAAFVALHLVNAAVSGAYFASFVKATLGQIPDQPVLASERGGLNNPDFIDFAFALFHTFDVDKATLVASALAFCGLILGVVLALLAPKAREIDDYSAVRVFGLAFLVCMLLLFRLKPYAFGALVPFAIAAVTFPKRMLRCIGYVTLSVLPWLGTSAWLAATEIVRNYYQIICLAAFIMVALLLQILFSTRTRPAPAASGDGPAPAG